MSLDKVWNEDDIREVLDEVSKKMNMDCSHIPIRITDKFKRARGRFRYSYSYKSNRRSGKRIITSKTPKEFAFDMLLLDGRYKAEDVRGVIIHEYCHFYSEMMNIEMKIGHGAKFKDACHKAGIDGDTYFNCLPLSDGLDREIILRRKPKYIATCKKCGKNYYRKRLSERDYILYKTRYTCGVKDEHENMCSGGLELRYFNDSDIETYVEYIRGFREAN